MSLGVLILLIVWVLVAGLLVFSPKVENALVGDYESLPRLAKSAVMLTVSPIVVPCLAFSSMFDDSDGEREEARWLLKGWWLTVTFREVPPR